MSISKGAFGQSAKGGFIESPLGVRGWPNLFSLIVGGVTTPAGGNNLFRLNPDDGSVIWGVTLTATGTIRNIKHGPSGRLYVQADTTIDKIYEIDNDDGSVLATSITVRPQTLDVGPDSKIYGRRDSDNDIVRLSEDLTTVEMNINAASPTGVSVDDEGNVYVTDGVGSNPMLRKYNSAGTLLASCPTNGTTYSVFSPSGDYVYVLDTPVGADFVRKLDKSTMAVVGSFNLGDTASTTQPQTWATDGTHIYTSRNGINVGLDSYAVKIRISDMTEVARFTMSTASPIGTQTAGVTKRGTAIITGGGRTDEWDGNDGSFKSVWALDTSMSLVWAADPSSTFGCVAISGAFVNR